MTDKIDTDDILEAISEVVDPEVNIPILEMGDPEKEPNGLIDEVNIDTVSYTHLTLTTNREV